MAASFRNGGSVFAASLVLTVLSVFEPLWEARQAAGAGAQPSSSPGERIRTETVTLEEVETVRIDLGPLPTGEDLLQKLGLPRSRFVHRPKLAEDEEGGVWSTLAVGAVRFGEGQAEKQNPLRGRPVPKGIFVSEKQGVWLSDVRGWARKTEDRWSLETLVNLFGASPQTFQEDPRGRMFVGGLSQQVFVRSEEQWYRIRYSNDLNDAIVAIMVSDDSDCVWFLARRTGLWRYCEAEDDEQGPGRWTPAAALGEVRGDGLLNGGALKSGVFWFWGERGVGRAALSADGEVGAVEMLDIPRPVWSLFAESAQSVWMGGANATLYHWTPAGTASFDLAERVHLRGGYVHDLLVDSAGRLWVSVGGTLLIDPHKAEPSLAVDADAARPWLRGERRREEARALGLPMEKEVDLGDGVRMELALILPGEFEMGSPEEDMWRDEDEGPRHTVAIERPFYIGRHPVTQGQWEQVMGANPSSFREKHIDPYRPLEQHPVENVSWNDCQEFVRRLGSMGIGTFRLPTEAEWEYACRAGTDTAFYFGDDDDLERLDLFAWHSDNSDRRPRAVGEKFPNGWGLFDMHGNVWEWCQSLYMPYPYSATDGREDLRASGPRVLRGGSFRTTFIDCRSAARKGADRQPAITDDGKLKSTVEPTLPSYKASDIGLRVVLTVDDPADGQQE